MSPCLRKLIEAIETMHERKAVSVGTEMGYPTCGTLFQERGKLRCGVSRRPPPAETGLALGASMSTSYRVTFVPQVFRKFQLHLQRGFVRHRVEMRVELRH